MMRSGLRRYPRELLASVREKATPPEVTIDPHFNLHVNPHGNAPCDARDDPSDAPGHDTHCRLRSAGAGIGAGSDDATLASVWLGHASVLTRLGSGPHGPRWFLADPVFSNRIGPRVLGRVLGLGRQAALPAIAARLPTIDAIFITHAHYDHLDRPTLERLADRGTVVVTPRRTGRLIPRGFGGVVEIGAGDAIELPGMSGGTGGALRVRAISPRHWGARRAIDRGMGFNAYLIEGGGRRVLLAGDTAETDAFDALGVNPETGARGGIDLAVMGIGAYDPWWHQHATPEQVWAMVRRMGARHLLPVHHSTYPMSDERQDEPMERLLRAAEANSLDDGLNCCRSTLPIIVGRTLGEVWQAPAAAPSSGPWAHSPPAALVHADEHRACPTSRGGTAPNVER